MAIKKIKLNILATVEEKEFINALGCNEARAEQFLKPITVSEQKIRLRGYIRSCANRVNWGFINKSKCEAHAQSLLSKL